VFPSRTLLALIGTTNATQMKEFQICVAFVKCARLGLAVPRRVHLAVPDADVAIAGGKLST
jgi:hypothetical protein